MMITVNERASEVLLRLVDHPAIRAMLPGLGEIHLLPPAVDGFKLAVFAALEAHPAPADAEQLLGVLDCVHPTGKKV